MKSNIIKATSIAPWIIHCCSSKIEKVGYREEFNLQQFDNKNDSERS